MTIEEWDASDLMDWSRRRDRIKPLFYAIPYGNLTSEQRLIGAKYFFVPYELRVSNGTVTLEQDLINRKIFATLTRQSRIDCAEAMRLFVCENMIGGSVNLPNTQRFLRDVILIRNLFIDSNDPLFKQWIISERGSEYEFSGFRYTKYWSQFIEDGLMLIYNDAY